MNKPGSDGDDQHGDIVGEAGTYGCLAVYNIYNVLHANDPITFRVNAAVDKNLAESLQTASITSSSTSLWHSIGNVFRWNSSSSSSSPSTAAAPEQQQPSTSSNNMHGIGDPSNTIPRKLPSNVELETHNFTREEIAEKRMLLLNDNGQIDYLLSGGGGPLSIQYLNMLNAHGSYWFLNDFVRFFVVEIVRKQGKDGTLLAFRAEKKKGWQR